MSTPTPFAGYEEFATGSWDDFTQERDEALLSLDERKIKDFMRHYRIPLTGDRWSFWVGVHKAREATQTLPEEVRAESRQWLRLSGFDTMDEARAKGLR